MTTHNRQIQATAQNDYACGRQCIVAAFLVAILAVTADAQTLTFNDPTVTSLDTFGTSVALDGNNILIGAPEDDTNGTGVGQVHLFDAITGELLDETPSLCVAAVDDPDYEPNGTGDVDDDGLTDYAEACQNVPATNPCEPDDFDGDGLFYPEDQCPLEGLEVTGFVDADGCPIPPV